MQLSLFQIVSIWPAVVKKMSDEVLRSDRTREEKKEGQSEEHIFKL